MCARVARGYIFVPKHSLTVYFGGLGIENFDIVYDSLMYFVVFYFILEQFRRYCGHMF
jgi:hypothetical protein